MKEIDKKKKIIIAIIVVAVTLIVVGGIVFGVTRNKNNKCIDEFKFYLKQYKEEADKYILGDGERRYNDLISNSEQAINKKDVSQIEQLKEKLEEFKNNKEKENEKSLKETLKKIKEMDISNLDDKDKVEKKIEEVDTLIKAKSFKDALDGIDDINILINKEQKIVQTQKKKQEEEQKKVEQIKVGSNIANRSNSEALVRAYLSNFASAVNEGNFNAIQSYIYPNSSLYNEQKNLVDVWYNKGIKEEFLGFTAKEVTFSDDKLQGSIISEEVFEISSPNKGTRTENFSWKYKFKYNTAIMDYQITDIVKP